MDVEKKNKSIHRKDKNRKDRKKNKKKKIKGGAMTRGGGEVEKP